MAIIITDQFRLRQKNFLDDRQGIATSLSSLKSWDFSTVPIPEGFEVYVNGVWYIYKSSYTDDPETGKFRSRLEDQGAADFEERISQLEEESTQLFFEDGCDTSPSFAQILTAAFWTDSTGENHAKAGRIVTVTSDGNNNGPWYLISSDYSRSENWVKLIGRKDLITTTSDTSPSDTNIYTAAKTNALFPRKNAAENITAGWTFKESQVFEKNLTSTSINAITGGIDNLTSINTETQNLEVGGTTTTGNLEVNTSLRSEGTTTLKEVQVGIFGSIKDEEGQTVARVSKVIANNLDVVVGSIKNLFSENGTIDNLNTVSANIDDLTVFESLKTEGTAELKEITVGENGSIRDEAGETVARVDRIVAAHSDLGDLDEQIRERVGLIGVGNFLKNTSFAGQFESLDLTNDSDIGDSTVVFNSKYDDWNVIPGAHIVDDSDSVTGHSMRFDTSTSAISQETVMALNEGASYLMSWKQKGTVRVEIGNYDLEVKTILITPTYKFCYVQITPTTTQKELVTFYGGPGNVFEIKFEEGVIPTSWFPSVLDTDPLADELYRFEYLRASFLDNPDGDGLTVSNLFLRNQIKLGDIVNNQVTDVYGGISGVVSDGNDVMIWSGSSYESATELLSRIENNESYLDTLTPAQLRNLTKAIITLNYKSIFTDIYAVGKFKGKHLDENGYELCSYPRITGVIPADNTEGKISFTRGVLDKIEGVYPTTVNFTNGVTLHFSAGKCTDDGGEGHYAVPATGMDIQGAVSLHLLFHEGYLVKISILPETDDTYYWY